MRGRHRDRVATPSAPVVFYSYGSTFSRTGYPSRYDAWLVTNEHQPPWQVELSKRRH